jgi:TolB-like protein/class 3 adenylate cyclase
MKQENQSSGNRQIACIMFSDIVGYTALMGENESYALNILKKNRNIHKPIIRRYNGKWIKELGDGVLATFTNSNDAILAAVDIQFASSKEKDLNLRIGLHLSEVLFENGDVFGDGVNITSRIQSVANIGKIVISDHVNEIIKRDKGIIFKKGISTRSLGLEKLKNVKEPMALHEILVSENYEFADIDHSAIDEIENSIAVLPFRNISLEPDQEYFSDGIAEELIVILSKIQKLKVVGRSSSFQFRNSEIPISDIGKTLNVNTLLEGSVRKIDNRLRISVELINVENGCSLWAERYDREIKEIYEIQDDIALNIANNLKVKFFGEEDRSAPKNIEAYEQLLKGRFYLEKWLEGFEIANICFTKALELDPDYAEAHAELAKLYLHLTSFLIYPPQIGFSLVKQHATRALKLNPELGAAKYCMGQLNLWHDWNFEKAIEDFEDANYAKAPFYFTGVAVDPWYKAFILGDFDGAVQSVLLVLNRDPLSLFASLHLGWFYTFGRKHKEALKVLKAILTAIPTFSEAERLIAYSYFFEKDYENALIHAKKAAEMANGLGWAQNLLIIIKAAAGYHEEAKVMLDQFENQNGPLVLSPIGIGLIHLNLGDTEKALDYFEKGVDCRDFWSISFKYSPEYDLVRKHPRFEALLAVINYPI